MSPSNEFVNAAGFSATDRRRNTKGGFFLERSRPLHCGSRRNAKFRPYRRPWIVLGFAPAFLAARLAAISCISLPIFD